MRRVLLTCALLSWHHSAGAKKGQGCEQKLDRVCPRWRADGQTSCLACVHAHKQQLEPECDQHKAEGKCSLGPAPPAPPGPHGPTPPPTPPTPPVPLPPRPSPPGSDRPNVVFMLTDGESQPLRSCLSKSAGLQLSLHWPPVVCVVARGSDQDLELGSMNAMSFTRSLGATGANLTQFMAHTPVCCPSRSELLTGRYFHNIRNAAFTPAGCMHVSTDVNTPTGDPLTFATALKRLGYATGMYGKYLNSGGMGKICAEPVGDGSLHVPEGWVDFLGACPDTCYVNCNYNHNGQSAWFTNASSTTGSNYGTSVIGNTSLAFAKRAMAANWPFFVYIASHAPHGPATPAPWYADLYSTPDVIAPRTPAFNVSSPDKHWIVATQPLLSKEYASQQIDDLCVTVH